MLDKKDKIKKCFFKKGDGQNRPDQQSAVFNLIQQAVGMHDLAQGRSAGNIQLDAVRSAVEVFVQIAADQPVRQGRQGEKLGR